MGNNERARLEKLHSLHILDTEPEQVFDSITRIAASLTDTSMSALSLVDARRQWFKSKYGLNLSETPRQYSFCSHVIESGDPLVVADAANDHRFKENHLVVNAPHIRFYAGVPLKCLDGHTLGTLCVIDSRPKQNAEASLPVLMDLATITTQTLHQREQLLQTEQAMQRHAQRFNSLFSQAPIGMALVAPGGRWREVNDALCAIVGYRREELQQLTFQDITHPDDLDKDLDLLYDLVAGKITRYQLDKRYIKKNGEVVWIALSVTKQCLPSGEVDYFNVIVRDIQQAKQTELALQTLEANLEAEVHARTSALHAAHQSLVQAFEAKTRSEHALQDNALELRTILDNANDAYVCMDKAGIINAWNKQAEATFGWTEAEAIGQPLDQLIIPEEARAVQLPGFHSLGQGLGRQLVGKRLEVEAVRKDGLRIPVEFQINAIHTHKDTIYTSFLRDITERKKLEQLLKNEAHNDVLTGLPNRRKLEELLPLAIQEAHAQQCPLSILFVDLDGFKQVNDSHGHPVGDLLLRSVAQRIQRVIRQSDIVTRFGGDEFVILLNHIEDAKTPMTIARKLLEALSSAFQFGQLSLCITASIGIATFNAEQMLEMSPSEMIRLSDEAMYTAKHQGKNGFYVMSPSRGLTSH